jgi:hypothetical protein
LTILFNKINLYLTSPDFDSELSYRNWLQGLLIHELTHIFELDASSGYASVLRFIFGKPPIPITTPNYTNPFWFHEGMAVLNETLYTDGGRLNSTYYDMYFRKNVLFQDFPPISRITSLLSNPEFPYGNSVYIYGAGIFDQIFKKSGQNPSGELADIHSGRFYYWFDGGLSTYTKDDNSAYTNSYGLFRMEETLAQKEKLQALRKQTISNPRKLLEWNHQDVKALSVGRDGENVYYITSRVSGKGQLQRYSVRSGETKTLLTESGLGDRLTLSADGRYLYFHRFKQNNLEIKAFPYRYDLQNHYASLLNNRLVRFLDLAPSPSGKEIAGLRLDSQGGKHLEIYQPGTGMSYSIWENTSAIHPLYINESNILVVDYLFNEKKTRFIVIDLITKKRNTLFEIPGKATHPYLDQNRIYFTCDQNGVFNIYYYDRNTQTTGIVTNLETGGFYPAVYQNKLYFQWLEKKGYALASLEINSEKEYTELSSIASPRIKTNPYEKNVQNANFRIEDYSPFSYLNVHWWFPYFQYSSERFYAGFMTSWLDPLYHHSISLTANYDWNASDPQYFFNYTYSPDDGFLLTFSASRMLTIYTDVPLDPAGYTDYYQSEYDNSLYLGYGLVTYDYILSLLGGGVLNYWKAQDKPDNLFLSLYEGEFYGPSAMLTFSNRDFFLTSIRQENGFYFSAFYTHFLQPDLKETGIDLAVSIAGILGENDVITSRNNFRALVGKKLPQDYYSIGGPLLVGADNLAQLRGYSSGVLSGYYYYIGNLEYSIPIFQTFRGRNNWPVFLRSIYLTGFYDFAQTAQDSLKEFKTDGFYVSYGAEVGMASLIGYVVPLDLILGYAYGYNEDNRQFYFRVKIPFDTQTAVPNRTLTNKYSQMPDYKDF